MKRVLIIGMSPVLGGVEMYIYNLIKFMNKDEYMFDFLVISDKKSVFEKEINDLINDNKNHFYYSPNLKKNYFKARKWLMDFYSTHIYDLVYLNTCTSARINYCIDAINRGGKLITHSHNGCGLSILNNKIYRKYIRNKSDKLLSCSDIAAEWLFGKGTTNVRMIANGVDTGRFKYDSDERERIRYEYHIPNDNIVIGHVGRFFKQKNQKYFIKLAKNLSDNYKFMLIGDGELKENFFKSVLNESLEDRFILLPSQDDVERYYSAMDIFAMPSVFEGLPIVAVEAQATGLPCVFSDNISKQTDLSGRCKFVPLNELELWIKTINEINIERYDGKLCIENNGFGVNSTVKVIDSIFREVCNNNLPK